MPKNRKLQNIIGTEHITDTAEAAIAAQASGGASVAFKNVAVSGQDNIVADLGADTLNIAAGSNITLTTNAGTDTLTIAAAGGTTGYTYTDTDGSEQFLISDTSDTALFKIEQAGTGNAFEVHDQASDLNIFKIDNSGKTVIGNTSSSTVHSAFSLYVTGDTRVPRLRVGTGSNGEPGIHFEGDSDTGIRRTAADKLGFITGGSERLSVGSAGEILIGGSAAGTSGQVLTSGGSGAAVSWAAAGGGGTAYQAFNTIKPVRGYAAAYKFINLMQAPYGVYNNKIASGSHSQTVPVYVPFVLPSDMTCTHLVINLGATTGNANVNLECAVYSADTNGYPSTQLFKSTFAVGSGSSTGDLQVAITNTGGTGALNGGEIYWVGANYANSPSGNITTQRMSDNSGNNGGLLGTNSPFVNMNAIAIRENGITSYQGMPSTVTVTTGTSWQTLKLDLIAIAAVFSA